METINIDQLEAISRAMPNLDIVESRVPFDILETLTTAIEDLTDNSAPFNNNLLGHIKEEYDLTHIKDQVSDYFKEVATFWATNNPGYIETFEEYRKADSWTFELDGLWVNKQKKHEFNPIHHHSGVLSFVIWINIPYDLNEEDKVFPDVSGKESYTSKFYFVYNDILGRTRQLSLPVDKNWEGTMLMFPSVLHHGVHPFYTSDDYRISLSGNIQIKVDK